MFRSPEPGYPPQTYIYSFRTAHLLLPTRTIVAFPLLPRLPMSLILVLAAVLPGVLATASDELSHLSPSSIASLLEIEQQRVNATTIALFSIPTFVLWCSMYFSAKGTEWALGRYTKSFRELSFANQRTCVMYILNIFYTTLAFGVQLGGNRILYKEISAPTVNCIKVSGIPVTVLYLFGLTYRPAMRAQMLTHHFCVRCFPPVVHQGAEGV